MSARRLRSIRALGTLVMVGMAMLAPPTDAQPPDTAAESVDETIDPRSTLSITVGGGASLGAYEAGYLYYFIETLKRNPQLSQLRIATGTSAGSLNAFLALYSSCMPQNGDPESSAFYESWTRTTLDALHDEHDRTASALLSRRPMHAAMESLERRWREGLPESCDVVLGVPATRRRAYDVTLHGHQRSLQRTEERFVLRIRGRGAGIAPSVENYQDLENGFALALLPVDGEAPDEFGSIRELLFASGAFPFVFAPVDLAHCMANVGTGPATACTPELASHARFIDGGFFENQPLRLAATIARSGLELTGTPASVHRFRERPDIEVRQLPSRTFFLELDPQSYAFPDAAPETDEGRTDVVESALSIASHVLEGMGSQEIQTLLETYPEVREVVRPSVTLYPPISSLLSNFFGFVDRKLADFDFLLGMHDAHRQLEEELFPALGTGLAPGVSAAGFPPLDPSSGVTRRFDCMRAFLDSVGDPAELCAGAELESFRAALQLTVDRLYSNCAEYADATTQTPHAHCRAAIDGEAPPRLVDLPRRTRWRLPGASEDDASRAAILRLAAYGFHFEDLGLARDESDRVLVRLRDRLGAVARDFVGEQSFNHQVLDGVVRAILNSLQYAPPHVLSHFVVGASSEVGVSVGSPYGRVPFLRASLALELGGLDTVLGLERYSFRLAPTAGLELEPTFLNTWVYQLRLGVRAGYSFSTSDHFGRDVCGTSNAEQATCSRMIVTTYAAVSLLELVRVQLGFTFRPALGTDQRFAWSFGPSVGIQLRSRR